ncbi:MAG: hypothetical protein K6T71_04590 [Candidatus Bipolaricaulota bacterium]|nr:hypothetical protein [Candidatus Bipolaricaulota bacterium]
MKNQYFGDINDYRKYGLLRVLHLVGFGSLLVAWMLTPDGGGQDGGFRSYLWEPERWRRYDPELYDGLVTLLSSATAPAVSLIEKSNLLPNTRYYSELVPDRLEDRDTWRRGLLEAARDVDWVFLDPDNGIEVPSKPVGRRGSSKYVTWEEIQWLFNAGCSLLIYQHFRREPREAFAQQLVSELGRRTGAPVTQAFRTPHVLFLLAAQDWHAPRFDQAVSKLSERWKGQIEVIRLTNTPL